MPKAKVLGDRPGRGKPIPPHPQPALPEPTLLARLMDDSGKLTSLTELCETFGMSKIQMSQTIGLAPGAMYAQENLRLPRVQTLAIEMLEVVSRLIPWSGGELQAMAWYRAVPIPAFGGRTAESLVKDGRAVEVRDFLDSVATGGFA